MKSRKHIPANTISNQIAFKSESYFLLKSKYPSMTVKAKKRALRCMDILKAQMIELKSVLRTGAN